MNIEEIKKLRKEVLDIRKQEEEQRNKDNELRNKYLWDIETQLRIIEKAKLKKEEGKELSPQEKEYFYKDYLELPYMIEDKFFNDVEKATGMFVSTIQEFTIGSKGTTYDGTLLFFEKDKFDKYKNGNYKIDKHKSSELSYVDKKICDDKIILKKAEKEVVKDSNKISNSLKSVNDNVKEDKDNKNNNINTIQYPNKDGKESLKVDGEKDTRDFERLLKALLEEF